MSSVRASSSSSRQPEDDAAASAGGGGDGAGADVGGSKAKSKIKADPDRLTPLRELQLVERHKQGDSEAMARLLVSYQRRVFSICYRMVRHVEQSADLTQDVLVKLIESIDSYDGRSKLSTWVYRIATNTCLSYIRSQKLRRHLSLEDQLASAMGPDGDEPTGLRISHLPTAGEPGAAEYVEQNEELRRVAAALDRIDADQRALLLLRDIHGLEYQELASVMEVPVGTIKSRLFRARAALREEVEQGDGAPEMGEERIED